MCDTVSLSPVRILDASRLTTSGLFRCKTQELSEFLRTAVYDDTSVLFIATHKDDEQQVPLALVGLLDIDRDNESARLYARFMSHAWIETETDIPSKDYLPLSALASNENDWRRQALRGVLRLAFFRFHLHRVSWTLPLDLSLLADLSLACGMRQEAILEEAVRVEDRFYDVGLFSLLATEYPDYAVAFVAYPKGVLAVRGSSRAVEGISFYAYMARIEDKFDRHSAIRYGVADEKGVLFPKGHTAYQKNHTSLPDQLKKAVKELSEYFTKSRTRFDVSTHYPTGSDFQRHVWNIIKTIPYGATVSYEDIAMELTGHDKVAARNLSRAVGSACADNPIPVLIPCHRVIGKDGKLVGYSGGVANKEFLLEHEIFGLFRTTDGSRDACYKG